MVDRRVCRVIGSMALCAVTLMIGLRPAEAQQRPQVGSSDWSRLPRMELERQYAGPLQDTVVQRWRDPADGTICYIYLPITAEHSQPTASGFVQYGANNIGSVSCFAGSATAARGAQPHAAAPGNSGAK